MLSAAQRGVFHSQGFLILKSFFSPEEVQNVSAEADEILRRTELIHSDNLRCRWQTHYDSGTPLLDSLDPVIDLSPAVSALARSARLLSALETLFGEPAFLFKDKLIYKPPGALGHATHQDFISWPFFPESFTTALVAIDPADEANGCLRVYRGQHQRGYLSVRDGDYHDLAEAQFDPSSREELRLKPGDVALFGCYLPHGSSPNRSAKFRRHLYLSYNSQSDGGDRRKGHYDQFLAWLRRRYAEYGCKTLFYK